MYLFMYNIYRYTVHLFTYIHIYIYIYMCVCEDSGLQHDSSMVSMTRFTLWIFMFSIFSCQVYLPEDAMIFKYVYI